MKGVPNGKSLSLTSEGRFLVWQTWDNTHIVYQLSSGETHFFNDTTALILELLILKPLFIKELINRFNHFLGEELDDSLIGQIEFACSRLEELGLIDCLDMEATGL